MARYGRFSTSDPDMGIIAANTGRACTYGLMPENGWGYSVGAHVGKVTAGDDPDARYGIYATVSGNPTDRMAYSNLENVTTVMASGAGGDAFTASLDEVDPAFGPSDSGVQLWSNQRYAIAIIAINGAVNHGMIQAGSIAETYESFYHRSASGSIPPDPYGQTSSSLEGWMSNWINYDPNIKPDVPINRVPTGTVASTTPTFTADFNDDNANRGDMLKQYHIQLRPDGSTATKWDSTYSASNSEQDANAISRAYGGTALTPGTTYEWRIRMSDQFGAWSDWSSWLDFTVSGGGTVTISGGTPSGRQEAITGLVFQARWNHISALAMDRTKIRLLQSGTVIGTSGEITKAAASSAAPGTLFSILQSESSIFNSIIWGQTYQYQVQGRATNGVWSAWSNARTFNINAQPNTPDRLAPTGNKSTASYPLLTCVMTDPDDTVATGLQCFARITATPVAANDSFQLSDASNWSIGDKHANATVTGNDVTYTTAQSNDGDNKAGQVEITASTVPINTYVVNILHDQVFTIDGGEQGAFAVAVRTTNANIRPDLLIHWYTAGMVYISTSYLSSAVAANTWVYRSIDATSPANAKFYQVGVALWSLAANAIGTVYVDNLDFFDIVVADVQMVQSPGSTIDWEYQTSAAELFQYTTYSWRAFGYDGSVYGDTSAPATFQYQLGPSVTISSPTASQVLTTSTPVIDWATSDQQRYKVDIFLNDGVTLLYTSGEVTSTDTDHLVPPGYLLNGFQCIVYVTVWNTLGIDGTSAGRSFRIEYPAVDFVIGVEITAVSLQFDTQPSAILLSWEHTNYSPADFEFYNVYRRESIQTDSERILLRKLTSPSQTTFLDAHPASDTEYIYSVSQTIVIGSENLESATTDVATSIHLRNTIITSVDDPDDTRIVIKYWSDRGWEDITDGTEILPWGASKPTTVFGSVYYRTLTVTGRFVNDLEGSIKEYTSAINRLLARRGIVCYRDPKGRRAFGVMKSNSMSDQAMATLLEVEFELTETNYTEGVI